MQKEKNAFKSEVSIDELLKQVGIDDDAIYFDEEEPEKTWSLDDIDALLAEGNPVKKDVEPDERREEPIVSIPVFSKGRVDSLFKSPENKDESSISHKPQKEEVKQPILHIETDLHVETESEEDKPKNNEPKEMAEKYDKVKQFDSQEVEDNNSLESHGLVFDEDLVDESIFERKGRSTGSQMETDKYRERFINVLKIEKTSEIDVLNSSEPIEKPGIILSQSDFRKTGDLSALPIVMPAEDALKTAILEQEKTRINQGNAKILQKDEQQVVDGQIVLQGFSGEEKPETIDELVAEKELLKKRKQVAKNFKLCNIHKSYDETLPSNENDTLISDEEDKTQEYINPETLEYVFPSDKTVIGGELRYRRKSSVLKAFFLGAMELVLLLTMLIPRLISLLELDNEALVSSLIPDIISFVVLVISIATCWPAVFLGFKNLFKMRSTVETALSLAVVAAFIQNILVLFSGPSAGFSGTFSAAAVFILMLYTIGRASEHARVIENFKLCAVTNVANLHSAANFEDKTEAFEIGRSLLLGTPEVRLSKKIGFPVNFMMHSHSWSFADEISKILVPCCAGFALIIGLVSFIKSGNFVTAFSALTAAVSIATPVGMLGVASILFHRENKSLNKNGAIVTGFSCADEGSKINAVAIDSADLFDQSQCELHGMKDYKNVRIDDVILYSASMVINSNGPLTDIFDKVITSSRDLLPAVKSLSYEDKMGLSGIIHKQKVLFGNRSLLVNHGVDVPQERNEAKYCHDGRRILYLAIAGKIAAMFVVSYALDNSIGPYLQYLEKSGINILVKNSDPNITENMLNNGFSLERGTVRILSPNSGRIFKRNSERQKDFDEATALNDGRIKSFLHSIAACARVAFLGKAIPIVYAVCSGVGLSMVLLFVLLGILPTLDALVVIAFHLAFLAISFGVGTLKGIKYK